jgi:hypothetical protein
MTKSRFKELVMDCSMSVIFGFFLIFYTPFKEVDWNWFIIVFCFNLLLELYKYSYRQILIEKQEEID